MYLGGKSFTPSYNSNYLDFFEAFRSKSNGMMYRNYSKIVRKRYANVYRAMKIKAFQELRKSV